MTILKTNYFLYSLALIAACSSPVKAQVLNGDFSSGVDLWTVLQMPSGVVVPGVVEAIDIDGPGFLGVSDAFFARVGTGDQRRLQQSIFLVAGTTYQFGADLACVPNSNNADGGTISLSIGSTPLGSFAFGGTTFGVNEYGTLFGTYVSPTTGFQTLSIDLSREFGAGGGTPFNYVDNVQFAPVPEPSTTVLLGVCGFAVGLVALQVRNREEA